MDFNNMKRMKSVEVFAFNDEDGNPWTHEMLAQNTLAFDGWYRRAPEHQREEWRREHPNWEGTVRKAKDILTRHHKLVEAIGGNR